MGKKITHLPDSYILEKDFPIESLVKVLQDFTLEFIGDMGYSIDITTSDGEYHYDVAFKNLVELFHQNKEVINSLTISELNKEGIKRSLVLYLNNEPGKHDLSFTVSSDSEEENHIMEGFLNEQISLRNKETEANTAEQLNESLLFNEKITANQFIDFLKALSQKCLPEVPFEIDIVTKEEKIIEIDESRLVILKNIIRKKDHHFIAVHKNSPNGSYLDISFFFESQTSGYCYFTLASANKKENIGILQFIKKELELQEQQQLYHKKQLIVRPQNQGIFAVDGHLLADQIIDGIEAVSNQFLSREPARFYFLTPEKNTYCFAQNQCDNLRGHLRKSKEGLLYFTKTSPSGHVINFSFQFRSTVRIIGYYYIVLRSPKENDAVRDFLIQNLSNRAQLQTGKLTTVVRPQLQDSFSFDRNMTAKTLILFLQKLSNQFLKEEIISVRLTTTKGEKHYFYDQEILDLKDYFAKDQHDVIFMSLKEEKGRSITLHLQFKSTVAGTNGYFSILMNDEEENIEVLDFLTKNLKTAKGISHRKSQTTTKEILPIMNEDGMVEATFSFDSEMDKHDLMMFLQHLSRRFIPERKMSIRAMTKDQEEYFFLDNETDRLKHLMSIRDLDFIYIQKNDTVAKKLNLYLQFDDLSNQSGYFSLYTEQTKEARQIRDYILQNLERRSHLPKLHEENTLKGTFLFKNELSSDRITVFLNGLARKFLKGEKFIKQRRFNFNIRNIDGTTYANIGLDDFRKIYAVDQELIHILSISSITQTGKYIEMALIFGSDQDKDNGNFTISCGSQTMNELVQKYITDFFQKGRAKESGDKEKIKKAIEEITTTNDHKKIDSQPLSVLFSSIKEDKVTENIVRDLTLKLKGSFSLSQDLETYAGIAKMEELFKNNHLFIVDISEVSPSLFYSIGLAHGQGKHLILLSDNPDSLPLSFKQYPHIIYSNSEKGLGRLNTELQVLLQELN